MQTRLSSLKAWISCPRPRPEARLRLFCFPYAGGGAAVYRAWWDAFPAFEVSSFQLPGREQRFAEPPMTDLEACAAELSLALEPRLDRPYAFFGHSLGAMLAFEAARHLRRRRAPAPQHLFVSACRAPQLPFRNQPMRQLTDAELVRQLRSLNGTPEEALNHPELMALMLPVLRADFTMFETYRYRPQEPLALLITAFGGDAEHRVAEPELAAWNDQTSERFSFRIFSGDHFYLHAARPALRAAIETEIGRVAACQI